MIPEHTDNEGQPLLGASGQEGPDVLSASDVETTGF